MQTPLVAIAGSPNCGKTALFNALTGTHQKVANFPGVTVEKKEGELKTTSGQTIRILDLPGTYSLNPQSLDEKIALDVLLDRKTEEVGSPDLIVSVVDASNLERSLSLILELRDLGRPVILALNMMDLAKQRQLALDLGILSRELGVPVVPTVATKSKGIDQLVRELEQLIDTTETKPSPSQPNWKPATGSEVRARFNEVDRILKAATTNTKTNSVWTERIDQWVLHPVLGHVILVALLATLFQAVFTWAEPAMGWVETGIELLSAGVASVIPEGLVQSLIIDGAIAGVGAVLVFLPQILLLFFFVILLEDSGYLSRAAFLMDRTMGRVGLHGRAFIPLLSSFACAIPGMMATRSIPNPKDRLATILIAPLMTCAARLPVYALLIAAFIPNTVVWGPFRLQGLVLFGLYAVTIPIAIAVAFVLKMTLLKGPKPPLILELPTYKLPSWRNVLFGLKERALLFLKRAGQIIFFSAIALWFLATFPKPPANADKPAIHYSYAAQIGKSLEPLVRPLGFDWRIATGLIPGFAAREVMVGALATVFAVEAEDEAITEKALGKQIAATWGLPTALALLVWFIFSPQCLSTFAVARRETNSYRWPIFMFTYLIGLAYFGAWVTYQALA